MDDLVEAHAADPYNADDAKAAHPAFAEGLWWKSQHIVGPILQTLGGVSFELHMITQWLDIVQSPKTLNAICTVACTGCMPTSRCVITGRSCQVQSIHLSNH